jgi:hypothetical protein
MPASRKGTAFALALACASYLFLSTAFGVGSLDLRLELMTGQELDALPGRHLTSVFSFKSNSAGRAVFGAFTESDNEPYSQLGIGVFMKEGDVIRRILHTGDALPDGAGVFSDDRQENVACDINESGTVAIIVPQGILVDDSTGLHWLVRLAGPVPGTSLTIVEFKKRWDDDWRFGDTSFLADSGTVTFAAGLSDGTEGILKGSTGGLVVIQLAGRPLPSRPDLQLPGNAVFYGLTVRGEISAWMASTLETQFAFLQDAATVHTVAVRGETLPGGKTVDSISELQVNRKGTAILAAQLLLPSGQRAPAILLWSREAGLSELVNQDFRLPYFPGVGPSQFCHLSLDEAERVFFAGIFDSSWAMLAMIEDGHVEVIAADGERTPLGGTFRLMESGGLYIPPGPRPAFLLRITETNGLEQIAFLADATGTGYSNVPFLWSRGTLLAAPLQHGNLPAIGNRLIYSESVQLYPNLGVDGSLFLNAASTPLRLMRTIN